MPAANFDLSPPTKVVDGLLVVPIDIGTIDAHFTFDPNSQSTADVTITYTVGPITGNPIFDLRQLTITQAWLDGVLFPIGQLSSHGFGTGSYTDMRIIESLQSAGSVHTLRLQYELGTPNSQLGGSYLPALEWTAGPKLKFVFGLSDLNRARYVEAWLPANLMFDQYSISLEIKILNTMAVHSVITNGQITIKGMNHWSIDFPDRFTSVSPMLEVRASDSLIWQNDNVVLPASGKNVTIETWKPFSSSISLTAEINNIKTFLAENENNYGPYLHDERFVAFFNGGGMEYEGAATTSTSALLHETFHSWFARGIKPASQADGWYDEGYTTFNDEGANDVVPFDFSNPPILLCSRDPWQRHTPSNSYGDGSNFWKGMASLLGLTNLKSLMANIYEKYKGQPVSTQMIEEFFLSKTGNVLVVDAFHRFVYGFSDPSPAPELWLMDDPQHTTGSDQWNGIFWDSPDLWVRNNDDGGTDHQSPEYGQDNWFYARVRNKSGAGRTEHFVVTFHSKGFAGTQFMYPNDFFPCTAAKAEFDLAAGDTKIVKALWPGEFVPYAGSHTCLLASVNTRGDYPMTGCHVWEDNNLAQKNLSIVDLQPDTFMILPIVIANFMSRKDSRFYLEIWEQKTTTTKLQLSLIHRAKEFFQLANLEVKPFRPKFAKTKNQLGTIELECGGRIPVSGNLYEGSIMTSDTPELVMRNFPNSWEAQFPDVDGKIDIEVAPFTQKWVGIKISVPRTAKQGDTIKLHVVQRQIKSRSIVGGVAIQINIRESLATKSESLIE